MIFQRVFQGNPLKHGGYIYKMTYEIVTEESAEEGDVAERGWKEERSEVYPSLYDLLRDVASDAKPVPGAGEHPGDSAGVDDSVRQDW